MPFRPFNASNEPRTCRWCGDKLRLYRYRELDHAKRGNLTHGDYGDGFFCGLRCAYKFAVRAAQLHYKFEPKKKT